MDPDKLKVVHAFTDKVFHCLDIPTSLTAGIRSHPRFVCFVVYPHCPVEDFKPLVSLVFEMTAGDKKHCGRSMVWGVYLFCL
jgi:hypothetical protein